MAPMFEWFSEASTCASRLKPRQTIWICGNVQGSSLIATSRLSSIAGAINLAHAAGAEQ